MGYMIEISESKVEKLSENLEKGIHYLGRAMSCIEEFQEKGKKKSRMSERYGGGGGNYGSGGGSYGNRGGNYNQRDDDDWDDDDDMDDMDERYMDNMGMRQGVKGTGPYSRYRYGRYRR